MVIERTITSDSARQSVWPPDGATSQQWLIAYSVEHDDLCPRCGHVLSRLRVPRCPGCGERLELSVASADPYLWPWLVLCIPLCLCAGVGLLLITLCAVKWRVHSDFLEMPVVLAWLFDAWAIPAAVLALIGRRWFLRWPSQWQWTTAVITAGLCAISMGIVSFYID